MRAFCAISGSPRWTALKSRSALLSPAARKRFHKQELIDPLLQTHSLEIHLFSVSCCSWYSWQLSLVFRTLSILMASSLLPHFAHPSWCLRMVHHLLYFSQALQLSSSHNGFRACLLGGIDPRSSLFAILLHCVVLSVYAFLSAFLDCCISLSLKLVAQMATGL